MLALEDMYQNIKLKDGREKNAISSTNKLLIIYGHLNDNNL